MADDPTVKPYNPYRNLLKQLQYSGLKPVAYDRHYRIPIYSSDVINQRLLAQGADATYITPLPGNGRANSGGPAILTRQPIDPSSISHELAHHIDTTDDPNWRERVSTELYKDPSLLNYSNELANYIPGNRRAEWLAYLTSDTFNDSMFNESVPTFDPSKITGNITSGYNSELSILDPAYIKRLQSLMYNQLNSQGKKALKSRQRP